MQGKGKSCSDAYREKVLQSCAGQAKLGKAAPLIMADTQGDLKKHHCALLTTKLAGCEQPQENLAQCTITPACQAGKGHAVPATEPPRTVPGHTG